MQPVQPEITVLLAVIYLRVSTEEQAKRGYSLPEQREACQVKAQELARQIETSTGQAVQLQIHEFVDNFGGDIVERPVLEEVRAFVRTKKPAYFICLDPDRFSRSLKWQLIVADEIEAQGTRLVFVQQDYDPSDTMSRAFFQFRGLMSEIEKAKIIERTLRGKRGKVKAGRRPNGAAPYGYRHVKESDQLEVWEPEAKWVRQIFAWAAEGLGFGVIAQRLNDLGVPTKRSTKSTGMWYRGVVRNILLNTTYIGEMRCNRTDFQGLESIRRLPRERRQPLSAKLRPANEWIVVPVPPIVDRDTFNQVQLLLKQRTRKGKRQPPGLLSLLVKCGVCGGNMHYTRHTGGRHGKRAYFKCKRKYPYPYEYRPGTIPCTNRNHNAAPIEQGVWDQLVRWLTNPDLVAEHLASQVNSDELTLQIQRLQEREQVLAGQLATKQREQVIIIQRQAQGLITSDLADQLLSAVQQQVQQIQTSIASLQAELASLKKKSETIEQTVASFTNAAAAIAEKGQDIRRRLESLSPEQKRELVLRLVQSVTIHEDGSWTITPR